MNAITTSLTTAADSHAVRSGATRLLAGVSVPDTPVVARAREYAREHSEPYLFNHVMRSWLFAAILAQQKQAAHDGEVLAVATLLHDLGLSVAFDGALRFEVEGANAARSFAQREGFDDRRAQLVWDGVALNSTPSLGLYKEAEVALCASGIGLDWGGWGYDSLAKTRIAEIVDAYPRLRMKPRRITQESLVMASWYDAHPAVRRLWALKESQTLHVIVTLEPTVDNGESYPVWFANNVVWAREIRSSTGSFVTLELVDEPMGNESEIEVDGEGEIIIAMCWRDPAFLWSSLL